VDRAILAGNALHCDRFGPVAPPPAGGPVRLAPGTRIVRRLAVPPEWFERPAGAPPGVLPRARLRWASPALTTEPREFLYLDEEVRAARVKLETSLGSMTLALDPEVAPDHVKTFLHLAGSGFYDGTRFYRVIEDFLVQGGCPNSRDDDPADDGRGAGPWRLRAEFSTRPMRRGALAMARDPRDPDSASCHFFILQAPGEQVQLNGKYTLFGRLLWGEETLDRIAGVATGGPKGTTPEKPVVIEKARVVYPE
jgi:peptidyl-prolyl cis-trans isomerase B (cyclophilin B)